MARYFKSDNTATASPQLLEAVIAANHGPARAYGDDDWSRRLDAAFARVFGHEVRAFPVATGTAANSLALATLVPPWGSILAHEGAHVVRDECGAPEFMTGGARLQLLHGEDGKLTPAAVEAALRDNPPSVHTVQPRALTLTQATEFGTCYTPAELLALATLARARGLALHVDGARFANAVAFLDCPPADISWRAGVDVLSFGATKNGALGAEAVLFFDPARAADFEWRRKRAGHLLSKMRYVSAQFVALLTDDLWKRNAEHANAMARRLAAGVEGVPGVTVTDTVAANAVFAILPPEVTRELQEEFTFYVWNPGTGQVRWMTSWATTEAQVDEFVGRIREVASTHAGR